MNIFVVTDNKWWLGKVRDLFKDKGYNFRCYCSPKGRDVFENEISREIISVIDVKSDVNYLINNYDFGFSIHCKQIFPQELVENICCVNVHPGLNPYNRGWFPQVFSIINKKPAGATIHLMDDQIDQGEVLYQKEIKIYDWDDSKSVYERILECEFSLLENNIEKILVETGEGCRDGLNFEGNYNSIKDYKNLMKIDLDRQVTMREAIDYLRAMTHRPYKNAYFISRCGEKIFVSIHLEKGK